MRNFIGGKNAISSSSKLFTSSSRSSFVRSAKGWWYQDRTPYVMHCAYPIMLNGRAFGCGQCVLCKVNKRRVWTHRICLEASLYSENCYITLSYEDEHLPEGGTLVPQHMKSWLKALNQRMRPIKYRYFGVGEYGDVSERPHYHLILFGMPTCRRGITRVGKHGRSDTCCDVCEMYQRYWDYGSIFCGQVSQSSAAYVAGYVTKKYNKTHFELGERHPEFARCSNRPGIGAAVCDEIAHKLLLHNLEQVIDDVPHTLRHGRKEWPLGIYLRRRIRQRIGRSKNAPASVIQAMAEKLQPLRDRSALNAVPGQKQEAFRQAIIDSNMGRIIQETAKNRRYRKENR